MSDDERSLPPAPGGSARPPSPEGPAWQPSVTSVTAPGLTLPPPPSLGLPPAPGAGGQRPLALRPMRVGETIDAAVTVFRLHWKTLMAIVAFVDVPLALIQQILARASGAPTFPGFDPTVQTPQTPEIDVVPVVVAAGFAVLELLIARPFLTAAILRAIAGAYLGETVTVGQAYRFALRRLGSILWVLFLWVLAIFAAPVAAVVLIAITAQSDAVWIGVVLLIGSLVFMAIVWVRWMFGPAVVVVEDERGTAALGRSWRLSKGSFWKLFGTTLLAVLLTQIVGGILGALALGLAFVPGPIGAVLAGLASGAASVVTEPFAAAVTVLLYFDMRIRKEAMDLSILAREVHAAP